MCRPAGYRGFWHVQPVFALDSNVPLNRYADSLQEDDTRAFINITWDKCRLN